MAHLLELGPKKNPGPIKIDPGYPKLPEMSHHIICPREYDYTTQAGLLTPGSSYLLRLPDYRVSDFVAAFVPSYSGGPVFDLHEVPY